ncbi:MAG: anaerobic ribonucleoside-triphosphate reductase activating protein [Candidatus Omnitrophica bacterium]|nr:anaerobic ribonucleoside-triphosphate reductase activating protein [Candidatus Omnitrophota bacterium]
MNKEMMYPIKGFNPHTFLDWEGRIASVIYLPGCNFRCPFCHSSALITAPESLTTVDYEFIKRFLREKRGWMDGVIIGGGEPTLYENLPALLKDIKSEGLLTRLDTNGSNTAVLKKLIEEKLLDCVAMDIKAPLDTLMYSNITASDVDVVTIKQSIDLLMSADIDYEFRTTVVPCFLQRKDILSIAQTIKGAKKYVLQQFSPKDTLEKSMRDVKPYSADELKQFVQLANEFVKNCSVRGI